MRLIRFLRRRFNGAYAHPETLLRPAVPLPDVAPPVVPEPAFPTLQRLVAAAPRRGNIVQSDDSSGRQDILRLAERRDTRLAVVTEPDARREILRLHEIINQLHRQRRRLREDRDRWERLARDLENELHTMRSTERRGGTSPLAAADRFRRAKMVLARLTHPDSSGSTGFEASIRAKLFQEFWAEFERIEAE